MSYAYEDSQSMFGYLIFYEFLFVFVMFNVAVPQEACKKVDLNMTCLVLQLDRDSSRKYVKIWLLFRMKRLVNK